MMIKVKSESDELVEFSSNFLSLSGFIQKCPDPTLEIPVSITTETLHFVRKFCEAHEYNPQSMKWHFPFQTPNLKDHIDPVSYSLIKQLK
jgi:hypothetical protein